MIRVLLVDDSAVIRSIVTRALRGEPDLEIVGEAADGLQAIDQVDALRPDAVVLDVEMPNLDGLGALRVIHERHPRLPVIMFSTLTERGAAATLEALSLGASDYVPKPSTASLSASIELVRAELTSRLRALTAVRRLAAGQPSAPRPSPRPTPARQPVGAVVIGSSTGGPDALASVLAHLPEHLSVPVLVVQHMPPVFTAMLAQRLDRVCPLTVREAAADEPVIPGQVLIAPGDHHLTVERHGPSIHTRLHQGPKVNFCRPAVDELFTAAAGVWRGALLGLVLTGMGQDGLDGARSIVAAGGRVVSQDEPTSVVWGMPGAVATAGLSSAELALDRIGPWLTRALTST